MFFVEPLTTTEETIRAIIREAHLKPIEQRVTLLRYGLFGSPKLTLAQIVPLLKEDETVTVKRVTRDWVRQKQATAGYKMRRAILRLELDCPTLRQQCTEEPYRALCDHLIGGMDALTPWDAPPS